MNEKNYEYLKKLLENLGFGTRLNYVLEKALKSDLTLFTLGIEDRRTPPGTKHLTAPAKDLIRYELNYSKSKASDSRFLNDMKVILHKAGELVPRIHTFDLERDHRITALQAYKLLSGQSFEKEVLLKAVPDQNQETEAKAVRKNMWFKLNLDITDAFGQHPLRKFPPEHGFDLEAPLGKYLLEGLDNRSIKAQVLKDLRNGNLVSGQMRLFDMVIPVYFAANPQFRSIDIYDQHLNRIPDRQIFPPEVLEQQKQQQANPGKNVIPGDLSPTEQTSANQPWEQDPGQEEENRDVPQIRR